MNATRERDGFEEELALKFLESQERLEHGRDLNMVITRKAEIEKQLADQLSRLEEVRCRTLLNSTSSGNTTFTLDNACAQHSSA